MLDLTPNIFPNIDWQLEDEMMNELHYHDTFPSYNTKENGTPRQSLNLSSPHPAVDIEDQHDYNSTTKKLSHNAYERDRRKRLNHLYSSLRSLLPEAGRNKKLSIPCTITRVVKYIPELQRHVEWLIRKKDEIQLRSSKEVEIAYIARKSLVLPVVSVGLLNRREVMIQICVYTNTSTRFHFNKVLKILEGEGLQLLNASSFTTEGDKSFYNLHLQAKTMTLSMEGESFCEYLKNILKDQGI